MAFDNVCKILAEQYPLEFARWLLPVAPQEIKVLKTELSIEPIRADSVIFLQTENQILHIEFQTRTTSEPFIPFRMLDYSVRLKRQYGVPVIQVVIFFTRNKRCNCFHRRICRRNHHPPLSSHPFMGARFIAISE